MALLHEEQQLEVRDLEIDPYPVPKIGKKLIGRWISVSWGREDGIPTVFDVGLIENVSGNEFRIN